MLLHEFFVLETPNAVRALVGLQQLVCIQVNLQACWVQEGSWTMRAGVWPLPCVGVDVSFEGYCMTNSLVTDVADIALLPGVNSHVSRQAVALTESLPTLWTGMWLLTCVSVHVLKQVGRATEFFIAHRTREAPAQSLWRTLSGWGH